MATQVRLMIPGIKCRGAIKQNWLAQAWPELAKTGRTTEGMTTSRSASFIRTVADFPINSVGSG